VELTAEGELLLHGARTVLANVESIKDQLHAFRLGDIGEIRVGFTGLTTAHVLPVITRTFRARYPAVRMYLHPAMLSGEQLTALREGTIGVALLRQHVSEPGISALTLGEEELIAVLPADHPACAYRSVPLSELAGSDFVSYPDRRGSALREVADVVCSAAGFKPRIVQEAPDTHTIVALVGAGVGVALLPSSVADLGLGGVAFRRLQGISVGLPIVLAWRANDPSAAVLNFVSVARECTLAGGTSL
jgi:DNA-binding transcriptional LysR family regulator